MRWNALKKYDSWTFDRIIRHIAYWTLWSSLFVNFNYFIKEDSPYISWLLFELAVLPVKISCAYLVAYFLMPMFLYTQKYIAFIFSACLTMILFGYFLFMVYKYVVYRYIFSNTDFMDYGLEYFYKSLELVYITALVVCIKFFQTYLYQEKVNDKLKQEKVEAELKFLKNQIQPHFLFNTLNNLYGMVLSNDKKAPNTIVKLSELLGYMLYDSSTDTVLLKEEIENLKNYISLEKIRYDRKLKLDVNIGDFPDEVEIAPMLLIPFLENAFKHGPANEEGESKITIDILFVNGFLDFKVSNTFTEGEIDKKIKSGIGLSNVKKRLELIYPDRHQLIIESEDCFSVFLKLNLEEA